MVFAYAAKAKLSLAIKNIKKKKTDNNSYDADFIDGIIAWNSQAKFAEKYLSKGRLVLVSGELIPEKWKDSTNKNRYRLTVLVNSIQSLDSKKKDG